MSLVSVRVSGLSPGQHLLAPKGLDDGQQQVTDLQVNNASLIQEIESDYGQQSAIEICAAGESIEFCYHFVDTENPIDSKIWQSQSNRYTQASPELIAELEAKIPDASANSIQQQIITLARERFDYGHADQRFNDGHDLVPAVCGTTKGSCVDINTYILAAANHFGLDAQYIAGYWFHPDRAYTKDMHCWLLFRDNQRITAWDLAHHLKWGVSNLAPGLNPAGGRRVAMSFGRNLGYKTSLGTQVISHFSEPMQIFEGCSPKKCTLHITIENEETSQ
jgi:hypothetical protein